MLKKWFLVLAVLAGMVGLSGQTVQAASTTSGMGFSVKPVTNQHQIDRAAGYFQLLVKPDQTERLSLKVHNQADKTRKIQVTPVSAYTNDNGVIAYKPTVTAKLVAKQSQFARLVSAAQTVTLAPNATRTVTFTVKTPSGHFSGLIDGGFRVRALGETTTTSVKKGFSIQNRYETVVGATLQQRKQAVSPVVQVGTIKPAKVNGQLVALANVQNIEPALFGKMTIDAKVTNDANQTVAHHKQTDLAMAPNSAFNYHMGWQPKTIKPGKYHLALVATSGTQRWTVNRDFTITRAQASTLNPKTAMSYWWLWLIIALIVIAAFWAIWRRRQREQR